MNKTVKAIQSWALFIPELKQLLTKKKYSELKNLLKDIYSIDLADGWFNFAQDEKTIIFKLLPPRRAVEVFEDLEYEDQVHILNNLDDASMGSILGDMPSDQTVKLFHRLPQRTVKKLSSLIRKEEIEKIKNELLYPENTAGSLMNVYFISVLPSMTAKQTLEKVQASARTHRIENFNTVYVTNEQGQLLGAASLRGIISSPQDIKISEVMSRVELIKVNAHTDQEEVAKIFSRYDLVSAPVVDADNRLLGVINIDDIVDIIEEEATEDIAKMAGTQPEDLTTRSVTKVAKIRMPWLFATWIGGIVTISIVGLFESTLSRIVVLAAFMPVIAGMGGNVGTQSSSIVVRGLATGEIDVKQLGRMVFREVRIGLMLGLTYGLLLGIVAYLLHGSRFTIKISLVVGLGILTSMTVSATMGGLLPIIFKKLNIDPAVATAPFVSTVTDIISIFSYFFLATLIF